MKRKLPSADWRSQQDAFSFANEIERELEGNGECRKFSKDDWRLIVWALRGSSKYVGEMANGFPRFIDVSERHEICRFDDGEWSLRLKQGDDRAHTRYLTPDEKVLVEAAFRAGRRCEHDESRRG